MDYKKLNKIKDLIYEAEGLLELLQLRPEKLADLRPLINGRLEEAAAAFRDFTPDESAASGTSVVEPVVEEEYRESSAPVESDVDRDPVSPGAPSVSSDAGTRETPAGSGRPAAAAADMVGEGRRPVPAFCLNDRFRFRRAIFGGSDAEFNSTMSHIASLPGYAEAEDYFYGDMGLDPENEDVADFMEIIKTYFGR